MLRVFRRDAPRQRHQVLLHERARRDLIEEAHGDPVCRVVGGRAEQVLLLVLRHLVEGQRRDAVEAVRELVLARRDAVRVEQLDVRRFALERLLAVQHLSRVHAAERELHLDLLGERPPHVVSRGRRRVGHGHCELAKGAKEH